MSEVIKHIFTFYWEEEKISSAVIDTPCSVSMISIYQKENIADISIYRWKLAFNLNCSLIQLRMHIICVFMHMFPQIYTLQLPNSWKKLEHRGFILSDKMFKIMFSISLYNLVCI